MKKYSKYDFDKYKKEIKNNKFKLGDTVWTMVSEDQELDFAGTKLRRKKYIAIEATIVALEFGQLSRDKTYFGWDADADDEYYDEDLEPQIFADIVYVVDGNTETQEHCPINTLYLRQEDMIKEIAYNNEREENRLKENYSDVLFDPREVGILIKLNPNISMETNHSISYRMDDGNKPYICEDDPYYYKTVKGLSESIDDMLSDFYNYDKTKGRLKDYGTYRIFLDKIGG